MLQGLSFGLERVGHQVSKNCRKWDPQHKSLILGFLTPQKGQPGPNLIHCGQLLLSNSYVGGCCGDYLLVWREWATRLARTAGNGTDNTQKSNFVCTNLNPTHACPCQLPSGANEHWLVVPCHSRCVLGKVNGLKIGICTLWVLLVPISS